MLNASFGAFAFIYAKSVPNVLLNTKKVYSSVLSVLVDNVSVRCGWGGKMQFISLLRKKRIKRFHSFIFMHKTLIFNALKGETYTFQCFTFAFNVSLLCFSVSFSKPWCKRDETLVQERWNLGARDAIWRDEIKSETSCVKFHLLK